MPKSKKIWNSSGEFFVRSNMEYSYQQDKNW